MHWKGRNLQINILYPSERLSSTLNSFYSFNILATSLDCIAAACIALCCLLAQPAIICLSRHEDALHSARLAVSTAHERAEQLKQVRNQQSA